MDETKVLSLITEGESTKLDFKKELDLSSARGKAEFVKDLISLANSAEDSGCLIVGVDDNKQIIGIDELNEEQIQQIAYTYITPPVVIRCALVPIANAGLLCVGIIEAKAQSKPHKVARAIDRLNQDDVFIRRGSVVMRASPEEIIAMHSVTTQPPREAQQYAQAAEAHIKLGNHDTAINLYTQAIERFPSMTFDRTLTTA